MLIFGTMPKGIPEYWTVGSMFTPFSSGYYVGRLLVEPHAGDTALMQRDQLERLNHYLYATGKGIERLDYPLIMKLATTHFTVHGDEGVPDDTLLVPKDVIDMDYGEPFPVVKELLLAKPEIVDRLVDFAIDDTDVVAT